jgi:catechol 2,3-dioxygenase-like lactoylglutathione lyase family enzyme
MPDDTPVRETRVALTVQDYDAAVRFYRDALGLPVMEEWDEEWGRGIVLEAGSATIEVISTAQAEFVERVEAGGALPDRVRLALAVDDSVATAEALESAGAERLGGPVVTPWFHRNVRVRTPDGLQLTLFTAIEPQDG